ncbi:MAG: YfhO family protein, partial [Thermodesulfobacteriota bacterium]
LEGSPNVGMLHGIEGISGFDADIYAPYARLLWRSQGAQPARNVIMIAIQRYSPLFRLLGLRHVVGRAESIRSSLPVVFAEGDLAAIEVPGPLPKGYLVEEIRVVPEEEQILDSLAREEADPAQVALMTESPPAYQAPTGAFPLPDDIRRPDWTSEMGSVWFVRQDTDTIHYLVRSEKEALLMTTEVAYPGWRAWIDGEEAPLLRANFVQRAVQVPSGTHLVTMRFEPKGWKVGMILSLTGLGAFIIVGGTCLWGQNWKRR